MDNPSVISDATVWLGDCREILMKYEPNTFSCVIADPPYGETALDWDKHVDGWLDACRRVMKPSASLWCFGSARFSLDRAADFRGWKLAQDVVWEKNMGSGFAADRFKRVHEAAYQFYPADQPWGRVYKNPQTEPAPVRPSATIRTRQPPPHTGKIGPRQGYEYDGDRLVRSVIFARSCHGYAIHPTQKPVEIIAPLLAYSCPPGGLVLEPFGGACSVAVAARAGGRRCVSIELRPDYYGKAVERLRNDAPLLTGAAA
jgi:site-specific DNA-methyltransferase (adenine-specific)